MTDHVAIAVVYAVEVRPEEADDVQTHTYERFTSDLPEIEGSRIVFASGALELDERRISDPDMDVTVLSHGRELSPIPYPEE
jgi:hypothetical protein